MANKRPALTTMTAPNSRPVAGSIRLKTSEDTMAFSKKKKKRKGKIVFFSLHLLQKPRNRNVCGEKQNDGSNIKYSLQIKMAGES